MSYPFYTTEAKQPPSQPVGLPKSRLKMQTTPEGYIADEGLAGAVNVALLLGQPLLVTGEPGTGKTQLAYSLAWQLGLGKPLKFETKSTSSARDLFYMYDAIGHFRTAQIEKKAVNAATFIKPNALGEAIIHTNAPEKIQDLKIAELLPYLDMPYAEPHRSVVLIDEIDKAPRDFPNDILNEVEHHYFRIPEFSNVKIEANEDLQPILVLTSNAEKYLPDAFLRRCIYYNIPFPERARLEKIVIKRLTGFAQSEAFLGNALDFFLQLRDSDLHKPPATAELLNWLSILRSEKFKGIENPLAQHSPDLSESLSVLVKNKDDQERAGKVLGDWLGKE